MKTTTLGKYLAAKRNMKSNPTLDNIIEFVEAAKVYKGTLTSYHYDLANLYLKKCK
jgi:hypothetical protein